MGEKFMRFEKFVRATSFDEAYEVLQEKGAQILGGTTFLRLNNKPFKFGIDLSALNLRFIEEDEKSIIIGAYTTLRDLETSDIIKKHFGSFFQDALKHIIGVQFRNSATIGGSVYGRYGFSDVITAILTLDCDVELHNHGRMNFSKFIKEGKYKDIIKRIIIKKNNPKTSYHSIRKSDADFPVLTAAVALADKLDIVVGARPKAAAHAWKAQKFLFEAGLTDENIEKALDILTEEIELGDDIRSSAEYKKQVVKVLVRRALKEVKS